MGQINFAFAGALLFAAGIATGAAAAPLTLAITGTPGAGQVTLTFGGSQAASAAGVFGNLDAGLVALSSQFLDLGDFTALNLALFDVVSGAATFSVFDGTNTTSQVLTAFLIDDDGSLPDDVGFSFGGPTLAFVAGDVISLSGSAVIDGLDIDDLFFGTFHSTSASDRSLADALDLQMTISAGKDPSVVPLPATLPLLAGAAGLFALLRRRRV